mmetsp:Transcript_5391/g.12700  ORF Transcript_5391/g.12700 Transcript_5391/m.12700 type:complete len:222 (+) Transcript_5391:371-1036(+)
MYRGEPPSPSSFRAMWVDSMHIWCAKPKSQILAFCAESSKMFMDFRSRCTTRCACRKARPSAVWQAMSHRWEEDKLRAFRHPKSRSCSDPPAMYSVTTSSSGGCTQAPMNRTSRGCRSRRRASTSFFMASKCASPEMRFTATSWPFQEPLKTCAEPPAPSCGPSISCSGRMSSFQPMVKARSWDWSLDLAQGVAFAGVAPPRPRAFGVEGAGVEGTDAALP